MLAADVAASPVSITTLAIAVSALLTALTPFIFRRWASKKKQHGDDLVSWKGLTETIQSERDRLQARLDNSEKLCQEKVDTAEKEWMARLRSDRLRIQELEDQVKSLQTTIRELRRVGS